MRFQSILKYLLHLLLLDQGQKGLFWLEPFYFLLEFHNKEGFFFSYRWASRPISKQAINVGVFYFVLFIISKKFHNTQNGLRSRIHILYGFPNVALCLSSWLNSLGNTLKGASFLLLESMHFQLQVVAKRSFSFMLTTLSIMLCWPVCCYKYYSFSVWSLDFKPWQHKCLSHAALWTTT